MKKWGITIGFTGTRKGMTEKQRLQMEGLLREYQEDIGVELAVHGDCVGADEDFDRLCRGLGIERGIRPCMFENMRARCDEFGARSLAGPKHPMARNREIVAQANVMFACPPNSEPIKKGSGTWSTIGFSKKARRHLYIVLPDGQVQIWVPGIEE